MKSLTAFALIAILCISACSSAPNYRNVTLPNGKTVRVLGVGPMSFSSGQKALMLRYQTELEVSDMAALRPEVEEIWSSFRVDAEKGGFRSAIISANEGPQGTIIKQGHSFNFDYEKSEDGTWRCLGDKK